MDLTKEEVGPLKKHHEYPPQVPTIESDSAPWEEILTTLYQSRGFNKKLGMTLLQTLVIF